MTEQKNELLNRIKAHFNEVEIVRYFQGMYGICSFNLQKDTFKHAVLFAQEQLRQYEVNHPHNDHITEVGCGRVKDKPLCPYNVVTDGFGCSYSVTVSDQIIFFGHGIRPEVALLVREMIWENICACILLLRHHRKELSKHSQGDLIKRLVGELVWEMRTLIEEFKLTADEAADLIDIQFQIHERK
ncbi:hypothetical protein [Vibrio sp. OPT18]|uniref:hypothetical protein n=1 Tax=Vibrio sp. OPT18 TaxID=2778641 RepID=UPI0018830EBA|nr:hypothetical protein [Vibrio sp. OPT18]MBE8578614.1 hypothetical protein [Vibrio sp. OPT18]